MSITAEMVKQLREKTGAGMMDCKKALTEAGGDFDKAIEILRKKGIAQAEKKASRQTSEGIIGSYIHMDKIGVLVEVNCETDFVARNEEFKAFVKDLAMHIAAAAPKYLDRESIPEEVIEKEKEIYKEQVKDKPSHVVDKIVKGKLEKFYEANCLMDQVFIKDPEQKKTIRDLLTEMIAKIGENIKIRRFVRFQVGEEV